MEGEIGGRRSPPISRGSVKGYGLGLTRRKNTAAWNERFQNRPKKFKRYLIERPWELPMVALHLASIEIQRVMRGHIVRELRIRRKKKEGRARRRPRFRIEDCERYSLYHVAALQIQCCFRQYYARFAEARDDSKLTYQNAAKRIQSFWRRKADQKVFRERLRLLRFRNRGDPALLLKSINPVEAALFDKAAKITLRFRFGGTSFPPNIYYKVYTNGPLCDVGSFAPRDYTRRRRKEAHHINNHLDQDSQVIGEIRVGESSFLTKMSQESEEEYRENGASGWYQRYENNGWRRVTAKTLKEADEDPVAKRTHDLRVRFHYSKVKRKEDRIIKQKQKKREWMLKMYREAAMEPGPLLDEKSNDNQSENDSFQEEDEEDDEDLLNWSSGLDFDKYVQDWQQMATSF